MSAPNRRAMVERPGKDLSVRRQCVLVGVARSGVYRPKPVTSVDDLAVMRRIDELHLELPFYGSRRMTFELNKEGRGVNRKRVRRLMRVMGIEALVPRPGTSKAAPGHKIYPYLLIPEEGAPQFLDDAAPRNGMMPPPDSEMIAPPITE
jgi:putative transposase